MGAKRVAYRARHRKAHRALVPARCATATPTTREPDPALRPGRLIKNAPSGAAPLRLHDRRSTRPRAVQAITRVPGSPADLADLYRQMIGNLNKIGLNHVGAVGVGGIGKTQLAIEFVHRFSFAFDYIFWVDATNSDKWLPQLVDIAKNGLDLKPKETAGVEVTHQYLSALEEYCRSHPQMLIVMNNVQDPLLLNSVVPLPGVAVLSLPCNLLFTTRSHFQMEGVAEHPVDILSAGAASALLASMRPQVDAAESANAAFICQAVGNLPLALVLIGVFSVTNLGFRTPLITRGFRSAACPLSN